MKFTHVKKYIIFGSAIILSGCSTQHQVISHTTHNMNLTSSTCSDIIQNDLMALWDNYDNKKISGNDCHMGTHMITREIVQKCGMNYTQENIKYNCRNAMIHGMMEGYALTNTGDDDWVSKGLLFCQKNYTNSGLHYQECVHGLGNGAIWVNNLQRDTALGLCEGIETSGEKDMCISGVYGGLFRYESNTIKNVEYCNNAPYSDICLLYVGAYFDIGKDINETMRCEKANNIISCGMGLGIMISRATDNDIDKIQQICTSDACIEGAIWEANRVQNFNIAKELRDITK